MNQPRRLIPCSIRYEKEAAQHFAHTDPPFDFEGFANYHLLVGRDK
jgi:hypothetical protein